MQPRAYGHLARVITAMCVSLHWINDITGQQERAMQNAFPLSEGPGPVTDQRGLVEVSGGGRSWEQNRNQRRRWDTRDGHVGEDVSGLGRAEAEGRAWKAKARSWEADYSCACFLCTELSCEIHRPTSPASENAARSSLQRRHLYK